MIQQGHRYQNRITGHAMLALSGGAGVVRAALIIPGALWPLGEPQQIHAANLKPLPMRYFHGEVPA